MTPDAARHLPPKNPVASRPGLGYAHPDDPPQVVRRPPAAVRPTGRAGGW
jgi:hypothetical protein